MFPLQSDFSRDPAANFDAFSAEYRQCARSALYCSVRVCDDDTLKSCCEEQFVAAVPESLLYRFKTSNGILSAQDTDSA